MKNNKEEKPKIEIELDSFLVTVCKNKDLQPFSNTFHFEGENPAQNKLGELFGIIRISDHSEESAYLPNLLSQVIKREFFLKPNRGMEESFEAALNKVNLALADLAQHEVTGWINHLSAVIGVIQNNEFHFTKLGTGQIFLAKNKQLVDISQGLNEEENIHPVKTFSDISSGKLALDDKVIFATKSLFNSLSWEELTRHTQTFTSNEFDNILKSTLDLEGEDVGAIVINIAEKSVTPVPKEKKVAKLNFFGESASLSARTSLGNRCHSLKNRAQKTKQDDKLTATDATEALISTLIPKKTQGGELKPPKKAALKTPAQTSQIKQSQTTAQKTTKKAKEAAATVNSSPISPFEEEPELFIKENEEEKLEMLELDNDTNKNLDFVLTKVKKSLENLKKTNAVSSEAIPLISKLKPKKPDDNIKELSFANGVSYPIEPSEEAQEKERIEEEKEAIRKTKEKMRAKNEEIRKKEELVFEKESKRLINKLKKASKKLQDFVLSLNLPEKLKKLATLLTALLHKLNSTGTTSYHRLRRVLFAKPKGQKTSKGSGLESAPKIQEKSSYQSYFKKSTKSLQKSVVFFAKLSKQTIGAQNGKKFLEFSKKHQKITLLIGALVFGISLLIFLFQLKNKDATQTPVSGAGKIASTEIQAKDQTEVTAIAKLESGIVSITGDKDELFIYTTAERFFRLNITNNKLTEIPLKSSVKDIKVLVAMPTLRLVFLVSEKTVFSYSPVMNRLTDVDIKLPSNLTIGGAGVYLQYLYVLDKNSQNIYQFPRKPGGFHHYKIRTASQQFFSSATDLAVDDSLLVAAENGEIQQYFEGKLKTSFSAKSRDNIEVKIVDIETGNDSNKFYALDAKNGLLLGLSKNNPKDIQSYANQKLIGARYFWINPKQDRAFISTSDGEILRLSL